MDGEHTKAGACMRHVDGPIWGSELRRIKVTAPRKGFFAPESLEDDHHGTTVGTMPDGGLGVGNLGGAGLRGRVGEQLMADLDPCSTKAIAQKPEVADTHETFGQDVPEKAA